MMRLALLLALSGCYLELATSEQGPSEPGIIDVHPPAIIATPGTAISVNARLFESDGETLAATQPAFRLTSSDGAIATVTGTTIQTIDIGTTSVEVTDGSHGTYELPVVVATTIPTGAAMFRCTTSPIVQVAGVTVRDVIEVLDAMGNPVSPTGVSFQLDTTVATVSGADIVTVGAGTTVLGATANGVPLLGSCVVVVARAAPGGGSLCDAGSITYGCWASKSPLWLSRPGASSNVRVTFLEQGWTDDCQRINTRTTQVTPDSITIDTAGVASSFSGSVVGVAPGRTRMRVSHKGESCLDGHVSVGIDLGGDWSIECDDGTQGQVTLGPLPRLAFTHGADPFWGSSGAPFGVPQAKTSGTSEVCGGSSMPCMGDARGTVTMTQPQGTFGRCTSGAPCTGASITTCRELSGGSITGPDTMVTPTCRFERGGGSLDCGFQVCSDYTRTCNNSVLISFCGGTDACYYTVNERRFECPSCQQLQGCAQEAVDYSFSLCK